jgi:hypothetical protein
MLNQRVPSWSNYRPGRGRLLGRPRLGPGVLRDRLGGLERGPRVASHHVGWSTIELMDPTSASSTWPAATPASFAFTANDDNDIEAIGVGIGRLRRELLDQEASRDLRSDRPHPSRGELVAVAPSRHDRDALAVSRVRLRPPTTRSRRSSMRQRSACTASSGSAQVPPGRIASTSSRTRPGRSAARSTS